MRRSVFLLMAVFFLTISGIGLLHLFTLKPIPRNSFSRNFRDLDFNGVYETDLIYNSYYFSGISTSKIYLGNVTTPLSLLEIDFRLSKLTTHRISIVGKQVAFALAPILTIDSPFFYLCQGNTPALLRGSTADWISGSFMFDSAYFMDAKPINASSFVLLSNSSSTRQTILIKENNVRPHVMIGQGLLQKQIDGVFDTDGMLHFSKDLNRIVYVYFYRNEYISIDTSLQLIGRGKTLDTISKAKINVVKLPSEGYSMLSEQPVATNRSSCVDRGFLFIESGLMAANEQESDFRKSSVIDMYDLNSMAYKLSFYIPSHKGKKLTSFRIANDNIIALYEEDLVIYSMNSSVSNFTSDVIKNFPGKIHLIASEWQDKAENL